MVNSTKFVVLLSAGVFIIGFLNFTDFTQDCSSCPSAKQDIQVVDRLSSKNVNEIDTETPKVPVFENAQTGKNLTKKRFDESWCIARVELNESDYSFAKEQVKDWNQIQGKARAKSPYSSYAEEGLYPDNILIESYEELPLDQLRTLAYSGDKWAMITFVQNQFADTSSKDEIAKKLLVQGAPYYALEHLVLYALTAAKTSYRLTKSPQKSNEYVKDALAYLYWGLENYSDGALITYLGITSREPFKSHLPPDILLTNSEQEVKNRYTKLAKWIQEERDMLGIEVKEPPKAARRAFAEIIAINQHLSPNQMDFLRTLQVTNNDRINDTPCVNEY